MEQMPNFVHYLPRCLAQRFGAMPGGKTSRPEEAHRLCEKGSEGVHLSANCTSTLKEIKTEAGRAEPKSKLDLHMDFMSPVQASPTSQGAGRHFPREFQISDLKVWRH